MFPESALGLVLSEMAQRSVYRLLFELPLFLAASGDFLPAGKGVFCRHHIPKRVEFFMQRYRPLFVVPPWVADDLQCVDDMAEMTPATLRGFLREKNRSQGKYDAIGAAVMEVPGLALQLLDFCLLDCMPGGRTSYKLVAIESSAFHKISRIISSTFSSHLFISSPTRTCFSCLMQNLEW
jgi:hypothetical protein